MNMARMFLDALLLIVSLLNVLTHGAPSSGAREGQDPAVFSPEDLSRDIYQQSEASHSRARSKRCTCYSYKDVECIYYCHLGIIWINTPQRTVPYGMSRYHSPQRLRRSSGPAFLYQVP